MLAGLVTMPAAPVAVPPAPTGALAPAPAPLGGAGGINPRQVGLGMSLNSIDTLMTQGNAQATGNVTDMAPAWTACRAAPRGTARSSRGRSR